DRSGSAHSLHENQNVTTYWAEEIQGALEADNADDEDDDDDDDDDSDGNFFGARLETIPSMDITHSDSLSIPDAAELPQLEAIVAAVDDTSTASNPELSSSSSSSSPAPGEDQEALCVLVPNDTA